MIVRTPRAKPQRRSLADRRREYRGWDFPDVLESAFPCLEFFLVFWSGRSGLLRGLRVSLVIVTPLPPVPCPNSSTSSRVLEYSTIFFFWSSTYQTKATGKIVDS